MSTRFSPRYPTISVNETAVQHYGSSHGSPLHRGMNTYLIEVCLCRELGGGRLDNCLDGKGAHREPRTKKQRNKHGSIFFVLPCEIMVILVFWWCVVWGWRRPLTSLWVCPSSPVWNPRQTSSRWSLYTRCWWPKAAPGSGRCPPSDLHLESWTEHEEGSV